MSHIVVTDEQANLIVRSTSVIPVRDQKGNLIGYVSRMVDTSCHEPTGFSQQDIDEARQDLESDQPRRTTDEVLQHLSSLED